MHILAAHTQIYNCHQDKRQQKQTSLSETYKAIKKELVLKN